MLGIKRLLLVVLVLVIGKLMQLARRIRARDSVVPALYGGKQIGHLLGACRTLHEKQKISWLLASGDLQLIVLGAQMIFQETFCPYKFEREWVEVTGPDGKYPDKVVVTCDTFSIVFRALTPNLCPQVAISWLQRDEELPDDAPIVLICPGLNCHERNLPGTFIYQHLLQKPWRVGVYLKLSLIHI